MVLSAIVCGGAAASPHQYKAIWGPVERNGVSQFPIYARLGVGIFEMTVRWDQVAPARPKRASSASDPVYRWPAEVDEAIREARRYGIRLSVMVIGAPRWANGNRPWNWAPERAHDFATFVAAASRRWPSVHLWMIWGEPTKAANFQPLIPDHGRPLRGRGLGPPRRYAEILDLSYGALKRVSRRNLVIGGNSYTVGEVAPLRWIAALRLPGGKPPRMDLYGHNPFTRREPSLQGAPLGHGYADFSDLPRLARWVDHYLRRRARAPRPRLFLSELTLPTDHPNHEFNFWLDRSVQARWLGDALGIAHTWKRIYSLGYLSLYDDPPLPDGREVARGLLDDRGNPKPSFLSFQHA